MVCCWLHSQTADLARSHLGRFRRHGPWSVWKWFSRKQWETVTE